MARFNNNIELVLLDVDGTIVNTPHSREIIPELVETVNAVCSRGVLVGLASGRNYGHLMSQIRGLGFSGPYICNDGGLLSHNGQFCFEALLPKNVLWAAWELARSAVCYVEFSARETMHTCIMPGYTGISFGRDGADDYLDEMEADDSYFRQVVDDHISKITFVVDTREKAAKVNSFWLNGPFAHNITLTQSFWYAIELTCRGVTKGQGLEILSSQLGIPMSRVMAIGDGDNDVELLRAAGASFAMDNASPKAKAASKYLAPPVADNGAGQVLERFVLNGEPLF